MIKIFVATGFSCLAIGSIAGYLISEATRNTANQAIAQTAPAQLPVKPLDRQSLERRFIACIGRDVKLIRYTDADLNNDLFECERQKLANTNR